MCHAQMILYRTLQTGAELAVWAGEAGLSSGSYPLRSGESLAATWLELASGIQEATLEHCLSPEHGVFKDNATAQSSSSSSSKGPDIILPQDANSLALAFSLVSPASPLSRPISSHLVKNWTPLGAFSPELSWGEPKQISPFISSFELLAHLNAGYASRALELIRRSWGWYLDNKNGTGSTVIEGYVADGGFGYRWNRGYGNNRGGPNGGEAERYVSHAHGWGTGPTWVLSEYVLGLRVVGRVPTSPPAVRDRRAPAANRIRAGLKKKTTGGEEEGASKRTAGNTMDEGTGSGNQSSRVVQWVFAPQMGDLTNAEGGFVVPGVGKFRASWTVIAAAINPKGSSSTDSGSTKTDSSHIVDDSGMSSRGMNPRKRNGAMEEEERKRKRYDFSLGRLMGWIPSKRQVPPVTEMERGKGYEARVEVPPGTVGEFRLPVPVPIVVAKTGEKGKKEEKKPRVVIDGEVIPDEKLEWFRQGDSGEQDEDEDKDPDVVILRNVEGGKYNIQVMAG